MTYSGSNDFPVQFLYHIPKTGGVALRRSLAASLKTDELVHLGGDSRHVDKNEITQRFRASANMEHLKILCGHLVSRDMRSLFSSRRVDEVAVVREPGEWAVSEYKYRKYFLKDARWNSFEDYLKHRTPNGQATFLAQSLWPSEAFRPAVHLPRLLKEVEGFATLGTNDNLDVIARSLLKRLGAEDSTVVVERANVTRVLVERNETPIDEEILDDSIDRYRELSTFDAALFAKASSGEHL